MKKPTRLWTSESGQWTKEGASFAKLVQKTMEEIGLRAKRRGYDLVDAETIAIHATTLTFTICRLQKTVAHYDAKQKRKGSKK
jgi:hypothetical protein